MLTRSARCGTAISILKIRENTYLFDVVADPASARTSRIAIAPRPSAWCGLARVERHDAAEYRTASAKLILRRNWPITSVRLRAFSREWKLSLRVDHRPAADPP